MDDLLRLGEPLSYTELMELTFDGLAFRLSATCWAPVGMPVDARLRASSVEAAPLPGLVLSHRSAHWVWWGSGLAPVVAEYTTRVRRRIRAARLPVVVHERDVCPAEEAELAGLALTTPERTLYDLLYELLDADTDEETVRAGAQAVLELVGFDEQIALTRFVAEQYRRPHLVRMRGLLGDIVPHARTLLPIR
ncbi:hypothetical protein [Brevibacterium luteolum]|uniref:hypothetical protein n=1 Tax=Brevibacterium luteolum TaxID=199591 RepID=UPI001C2143D4|nr:hypothetical protein [Brevibacterium luteolum]MBU8577368.1 hypothetical protein [Brevibacterium luteolum]